MADEDNQHAEDRAAEETRAKMKRTHQSLAAYIFNTQDVALLGRELYGLGWCVCPHDRLRRAQCQVHSDVRGRDYNSHLWLFSSIHTFKSHLLLLDCSQLAIVNGYEDHVYNPMVSDYPRYRRDCEEFLDREEHLALCQLRCERAWKATPAYQNLSVIEKRRKDQDVEQYDMTYVRRENEPQRLFEERVYRERVGDYPPRQFQGLSPLAPVFRPGASDVTASDGSHQAVTGDSPATPGPSRFGFLQGPVAWYGPAAVEADEAFPDHPSPDPEPETPPAMYSVFFAALSESPPSSSNPSPFSTSSTSQAAPRSHTKTPEPWVDPFADMRAELEGPRGWAGFWKRPRDSHL